MKMIIMTTTMRIIIIVEEDLQIAGIPEAGEALRVRRSVLRRR
jgi:hypothetical protein